MVNTPQDDERQEGLDADRGTWFYWVLIVLLIIGVSVVYSKYHSSAPLNPPAASDVVVP
jgi:hypothetical protein